ncbi:hypothetical protein ACJMK2_012191 [Sinanodonta woodiana]|uniref:DNTTIP1 n=1 Tax=Sinanodonta woodiana TaxID=1069815 RepID=A0ABD3V7E9_SINWO
MDHKNDLDKEANKKPRGRPKTVLQIQKEVEAAKAEASKSSSQFPKSQASTLIHHLPQPNQGPRPMGLTSVQSSQGSSSTSSSTGILSRILRGPRPEQGILGQSLGGSSQMHMQVGQASNAAQHGAMPQRGTIPLTVHTQRLGQEKVGLQLGNSPQSMLSRSTPSPSRDRQSSPASVDGQPHTRTPVTVPIKKSLSPSRLIYQTQSPPQQGIVSSVSSTVVPTRVTSSPHQQQQQLQQKQQHQQQQLPPAQQHKAFSPSHTTTPPGGMAPTSQTIVRTTVEMPQVTQRPQGVVHSSVPGNSQILNRLVIPNRVVSQSSQHVESTRLTPSTIQHTRPSQTIVVSTQPQPAHMHTSEQRLSPVNPKVTTIRRTPSPAHIRSPSPAHVSISSEAKPPTNLRNSPVTSVREVHTQPVNLSLTSQMRGTGHSVPDKYQILHSIHLPAGLSQGGKGEGPNQGRPSESEVPYRDLLQNIQRSQQQVQSSLMQSGLSPITPMDSEDSNAQHPFQFITSRPQQQQQQQQQHQSVKQEVGVFQPQSSVQRLPSQHQMVKDERKTPSPQPLHNTVKAVPSSNSAPMKVVIRSRVGEIKQPVVSLLRLPTTVTTTNVEKQSTTEVKTVACYPSSVMSSASTTANASSSVPQGIFKHWTASASHRVTPPHPPNPFTFPATPPVTMVTTIAYQSSKPHDSIAQRQDLDQGKKQRHSSSEMPKLSPISDSPRRSSSRESDTKEKLVPIPQPFNLRVQNLANFPSNNLVYRPGYRTHSVAIHRAKAGIVTSAAKSLDILRQNIQKSLNREINQVIQKYMDKFFVLGIKNIRLNNGAKAVSDEHIQAVCRQILEEAKKMYLADSGRRSVTPVLDIPDNVSETGSTGTQKSLLIGRKRRLSDTDSEASIRIVQKKRKGRPPLHMTGRVTPSKLLKEPIRRDGPKWDPERLTLETKFIMGARANKALGFGATRGRLYIKHPELFKYSGDQDDKQWLYDHHHMPATGGKAYMLTLEDMKDLAESDEYKGSPGLLLHELQGFIVPEWMLGKMKQQMLTLRTDNQKGRQQHSRSTTPVEMQSGSQQEGDDDNGDDPKNLPFAKFSSPKETKVMESTSRDGDLEFLSGAGNDDASGSGMSPFNMTGGFDDAPSPSSLDPLEDDSNSLVNPFSIH